MHGEVKEWCEDWSGNYPAVAVTDPKGPKTGEWRVSRGGNNFDLECGVRSSNRWMEKQSDESGGFRLARTI